MPRVEHDSPGEDVPFRSDLIRLEARPHQRIASYSRTVLVTNPDGMITDDGGEGVFIHETRMLSRYVWKINRGLYTVEASNVRQHSMLVYAIAPPRRRLKAYSGVGHHKMLARDATEETIALRLSTVLSDGFRQRATVCNFTIQPQEIELELELDADFWGLDEVLNGRQQTHGPRRRAWARDGAWQQVAWQYEARHRGEQIARGSAVRIEGLPAGAKWSRRGVSWRWRIEPGATAAITLELTAEVDGKALRPGGNANRPGDETPTEEQFLRESAHIPVQPGLVQKLEGVFERARRDMIGLRVYDLDRTVGGQPGWVPAAGIPNYVATFGRDMLTAAWQSAILGPGILRGALQLLRELQGTRDDPWRDEEPGKMLHEAHTGPTAVLDYRPQGRYYGSFNTSPFYIVVLSEFYHWTGDRATTLRYLPAARAALAWMDRYGHPGPKHFYAFRTRSSQGVKNQGWKDSGDAIIYPDGKIVPDPIATCEIQGYGYEAKLRMAELLWLAGERWAASRTLREAHELKQRFNDAFWMPEANYFAMGLDAKGRQIKSVGSDPADAMATGILAPARVPATVERLFAPDMFSGWGIRTLSSRHFAFNPYSYHRGSVWPSENAAIGVGLRRYGMTDRLAQLTRAQLEIAERFQFARLPEVFSGHAKCPEQPFPPVYPMSCSPQAWSAGAPLIFLQMLLGIYPYAPLHTLFLDPKLPAWLPEFHLRGVRVGAARVDLDFWRTPGGASEYKVRRLEGKLHIVKQASPWSLFATAGKRIEDLLDSLAA